MTEVRKATRDGNLGSATMARRPKDLHTVNGNGSTVLSTPMRDRIIMFGGLPLLGLLLALGVPPLARWALDLDTALPVKPLFWGLGSIDKPWKIMVSAAIGILVGLGAALAAYRGATKVTLTDSEIRVDAGDVSRTIAGTDVAAVFPDGKNLVVLDSESRQLAREPMEASREDMARAFRAHGYRWHDRDPYADLYNPWNSGATDLPTEVNAVLAAREAALRRKSGVKERRDLRDAAQKLGYVVREDGTRQFWRPLVRS